MRQVEKAFVVREGIDFEIFMVEQYWVVMKCKMGVYLKIKWDGN